MDYMCLLYDITFSTMEDRITDPSSRGWLLILITLSLLYPARLQSTDLSVYDVTGSATASCSVTLDSHIYSKGSLRGDHVISVLNELDSCIEENRDFGGMDVHQASDVLMTLGTSGIFPTIDFQTLHRITEKVTNTLGKLFKYRLRRPDMLYTCTEKRALPSLFRSVELFIRTLAVQQLIMEEDISVYFKHEHIEIGLLIAEEHHVEVVRNLSTAGFDVDFPALIQEERSVGVILYKDLDSIFQDERTCADPTSTDSGSSTDWIGSDVLSTSVYSLADEGEEITNITMIFNIKNLPDNTTATCAYWKFAVGEGSTGYWSGDGCVVHERGNTTVSCVCSHLTNFAILIQITDFQISEADRVALSVISYAGCTVSIIGAVLSVSVFMFLRIFKDRVLIHLNLALAIIGAQATFVIEEGVPRHTTGCVLTVVLLYYFHMAIFCWMLCEGIHIYLSVVVVFTSGHNMKYYYLLGWVLPLLIAIVGTAIANKSLGQHEVCWFSPTDNSILVFVIPAMCVVAVNVIILIRVINVILRLNRLSIDNKLKRIGKTAKASVLLLPILGVTWLFGVLALSEETVVFQYLFAVTNSIQGLVLFVGHCVTTSEVHEAFKRKKNAWDINRQLAGRSKVRPASNTNVCFNRYPKVAITVISTTSSDDK